MKSNNEFIENKIKTLKIKQLINKTIETNFQKRIKKRSMEQIDNCISKTKKIIKYDINNDKKIDLPERQSITNVFKPKTPTKKKQRQNNNLKRLNSCENIIRQRRRSVEPYQINSTLHLHKGGQTFDFQYQLHKQKQYYPKKRLWGSAKIIVMRQTLSKDKLINNDISSEKILKKVLIKKCSQPEFRNNKIIQQQIEAKNFEPFIRNQQPQFELFVNHLDPIKLSSNKLPTRSRQYKQIIKNKTFKSKISIVKKQQQLCAWDSPLEKHYQESSLKQLQKILQSYL